MNDTLDFEQRLSRAMHDLVPEDLGAERDASAAPLRRSRQWVAVSASVGTVAAAGIALAVLPGHHIGPQPADRPHSQSATVAVCSDLETDVGKLRVMGDNAATSITLRNSGPMCRLTTPEISVNQSGVARRPVRSEPGAFPVTVPKRGVVHLRISYRVVSRANVVASWEISLELGHTVVSAVLDPKRPVLMPRGYTVNVGER